MERNLNWKDALRRLGEQIQVVQVDEPAPPSCPVCNDTGFIRYDVPIADSRFGKIYACPEPGCATAAKTRQNQSDTIMKHSTWEADYSKFTFDSFYQLVESLQAWPGKRGAYAAANTFAYTLPSGDPFTLQQAAQYVWERDWPDADDRASNSLVLTGDVGLGKTSLAAAVTNALRQQSVNVVFSRTLDLIERVQETYQEGWQGKTADQVKGFFARVPYLILDEFGIKSYTNNRLETLEDIIRERDRRGLPFLITTNLTLEQVYELWQPQIADIVAKAHWVEIGGVKLRQTARKVEQW